MKNPRCCEHTEENTGPCLRCRQPMTPRPVKFIGKKEWGLMWMGRFLHRQRGTTLSDILDVMKHVEEREERRFMIMCPNGVKLSIGVARVLKI